MSALIFILLLLGAIVVLSVPVARVIANDGYRRRHRPPPSRYRDVSEIPPAERLALRG